MKPGSPNYWGLPDVQERAGLRAVSPSNRVTGTVVAGKVNAGMYAVADDEGQAIRQRPGMDSGWSLVQGRQPGELPAMYETFEHTADLGLRIRAADLNHLFAEAGQALFSAIVENPEAIEPRQAVTLELAGDELTYLLFDWLNEWLFRYETEHFLFRRFEVQVRDNSLRGTAWGEPLDRARHVLDHEVKAITYHHLRLEQTAAGWLAEVIVDI